MNLDPNLITTYRNLINFNSEEPEFFPDHLTADEYYPVALQVLKKSFHISKLTDINPLTANGFANFHETVEKLYTIPTRNFQATVQLRKFIETDQFKAIMNGHDENQDKRKIIEFCMEATKMRENMVIRK